MLTGTLIYSLFGGESRWVFVTGSFNDTVSFLLQCRIQKQETVRVRGIGKTNVGQGELQVAPALLISPPLLRFLLIPTSFRENPLWFFIARCKGLRKGSFVEAELEFFARCRSRHGTWFLVPFFLIKPLPSSFILREPSLVLVVFLLKPLIFLECFEVGPYHFPVTKNKVFP